MADASDDEREEELATLQSIFPDELVIDTSDPYHASLLLPVALAKPASVTSDVSNMRHELSYLPPLRIEMHLPEGYPYDTPPRVKLSTEPAWLPPDLLLPLEQQAGILWEEYGHGQVLYSYISHLQDAAENGFGLMDSPGSFPLVGEIGVAVLQHDAKEKKKKFDNETFDCGICLEPKKGSACYRIERCQHVFCVACLQDFYNNCISEGDVNSVKCLDPDCGKQKNSKKRRERHLRPAELLQIPLEREMVQRYADIKRKKKIESDPSTIYCPRKWCQGAVRSKKFPKITELELIPESDDEDADDELPPPGSDPEKPKPMHEVDRLVLCEKCDFAFCKVCYSSWHGEFIRCWPRDAEEMSKEDQASINFILSHTSPCPACEVPCQKQSGCNHMSCSQCRTHFCYLCSSWLDPGNPYNHFNDPDSKCHGRLFELVEGDDGRDNAAFAGVRGAEAAAQHAERVALEMQLAELQVQAARSAPAELQAEIQEIEARIAELRA